MFRFTPAKLSMSPYAIFVKDVRRKTASKAKLNMRTIKKQYKQLSQKEKRAFVRRAKSLRNPNLDTFNSFQKRHAKNFAHLPLNARSRAVGALFRQYKAGKPLNFAAAEKEVKLLTPKARKPVKRTVKKAQIKAKAKQLKAKVAKALKAEKAVASKKVKKAKKTKKTKKVKKAKAVKKVNRSKKVKKVKKVKKANKSKKSKK